MRSAIRYSLHHDAGTASARGGVRDAADYAIVATALRARAALAAKPIAGMDAGEVETDVQYEVWQDDMLVAGSDSQREGRHYLAVYGQDGPAILKLATTTRKVLATNQEDGK